MLLRYILLWKVMVPFLGLSCALCLLCDIPALPIVVTYHRKTQNMLTSAIFCCGGLSPQAAVYLVSDKSSLCPPSSFYMEALTWWEQKIPAANTAHRWFVFLSFQHQLKEKKMLNSLLRHSQCWWRNVFHSATMFFRPGGGGGSGDPSLPAEHNDYCQQKKKLLIRLVVPK